MRYSRVVASLAIIAIISSSTFAGMPSFSVRTASSAGAVPGGQAFSVLSVRHETTGALTRILVESSSPPLYAVLRPTDRLIIIDLPGGEGSRLASSYPVKSALVDSINVRKGRDDDRQQQLTRLEIAVRAEVRDRSSLNGNTLVIELSPLQTGIIGVSTPSDNNNRLVARTDASNEPPERQQVRVTTANARPGVVVNPRAVSSRTASLVHSVRTETMAAGLRVIVEGDGALKFNDFTLSDPERIIVDVTGVRSTVGNKTIPVGTASVDRVRVGQPNSNVLRIVLDSKTKVPYTINAEGSAVVLQVGDTRSAAQQSAGSASNTRAASQTQVPGTTDNKAQQQPNAQSSTAAKNPQPLISQSQPPPSGTTQRVTGQLPKPGQQTQPTDTATKPAGQPRTPTTMPARDAVMPGGSPNRQQAVRRTETALCDPDYVGGPISFDLRAGVDLRDMLRFISQQYGINFIVDRSVTTVPVDIRVTDIPWNHAIESVLRANRLGAVCESDGRIIRIATLGAIKEEKDQQKAVEESRIDALPVQTKIVHLRYARAVGSLGATGSGASGRGGGGGGGGGLAGGGARGGAGQQTGNLLKIIESRLSKRGKIEVDQRTNSLIITDLPENIQAIDEMIAILDKPEPQVEIEARIVIANRSFLRDIGTELGAAGINTRQGATGLLETSPLRIQGPGSIAGQGGGASGGGGGAGGQSQLGPNLLGPLATDALRATANTVLSLTTGAIGTSILSLALTASERKGQIRTIASPRITAQDNQTAEIVNGVQIPVQTVSNNTVTTTFVTAALRLEITPQVIEETGEVLMHVVAENNSVNTQIAQALNSAVPGIDTQSAESVVRVSDGGTTVMGGITIDRESQFTNRTPGVSRLPLFGNMFKRKNVDRSSDEILFFITPRIVRPDGTLGPPNLNPQRSAAEAPTTPTGGSKTAPAQSKK